MRIRTIKPEFWTDKRVASWDLFTRLLFIGLWSAADDHGCGSAEPARLAACLFPYDLSRDPRETLDRVSESLAVLSGESRVTLYRVQGEDYFHVENWTRHQRVDNPGKSRIPKPQDGEKIESSRDPRETLARPSPLEQGTGNRGTGNKGSRESAPPETPRTQPEASDLPVEELPLEETSGTPQDESNPPIRSGDPTPTPKVAGAGRTEASRTILEHLNTRASRSFRPSDQYLKAIDARLAEVKGDVSGVLAMIDRQVALWAHDPQMAECLNPVTLFRPSKFPRYYDDRNRPLPAPGVRNGCAGARPHRNDFIGTPESRAAWAAQCAAADERLVEGF